MSARHGDYNNITTWSEQVVNSIKINYCKILLRMSADNTRTIPFQVGRVGKHDKEEIYRGVGFTELKTVPSVYTTS